MATVLVKDLVRESTEKHGDREIVVTLTKDQKIKLKEKGLRGGDVSIPIMELFKQLKGLDGDTEKPEPTGPVSVKPSKKTDTKSEKARLLQEIRSQNAISTASVQVISQVDGIIATLLRNGE